MIHESIKVGSMTLGNRLVMPPMATYKTENAGLVSQELCDYYEARAKSGKIGLIITEHTCISQEGLAGKGQMSMMDDSVIEPAKKLTEVIKKYGVKVVCQLNHGGSATNEEITGLPIVSASAVPCPGRKSDLNTDILPKELTVEEIHELEDKFAQAALRAKKAGYDGVEIHSAHGYLLNEFYSPLTNHRHDEYGCDSMENRLRFAIETVKKTRALVGDDYPIFFRLGGCDYMEGGSTVEDAAEAAKLMEKAGIDCIDLSGGMCRFMRPGHKEAGYFRDMSEAVKAVVSIPVILTGGVKTGAEVEELLKEGAADLIGVGRALLADADWAEKEIADFTHFNEQGRAKMVNVNEKAVTTRTATAAGRVLVNKNTFDLIKGGGMKKGDVLTVAQIAGVMGAKRTPDLIPMCHPILIDGINLDLSLDAERCSVEVQATVTCAGRTGVEMEALTAVSTACLTVYDMCKAVQKDMVITDIRLLKKTGGVHGDFEREE